MSDHHFDRSHWRWTPPDMPFSNLTPTTFVGHHFTLPLSFLGRFTLSPATIFLSPPRSHGFIGGRSKSYIFNSYVNVSLSIDKLDDTIILITLPRQWPPLMKKIILDGWKLMPKFVVFLSWLFILPWSISFALMTHLLGFRHKPNCFVTMILCLLFL